MYLAEGESWSGDEALDAVKGAVEVVRQIPNATVDAKVARLKMVMPLLPIDELSRKRYEMSSLRAFIRTDERPADYREQLADVEFFGETGVIGQMFRYLYSDEEVPPVNDLGLTILNPVLIGFDVRQEYGIEKFSLQVPVMDIVFAQQLPVLW